MPSDELGWIGQCAHAACLTEAMARKPGNVHPEASFADLSFADFVASARAIALVIDRAPAVSVGQTILDAALATRDAVGKNTNLGIILLLAPLARVPACIPLRNGIAGVLNGLTVDDARLAYQAIRAANPGGMGEVKSEDVSSEPTVTLLEAMQMAADRDLIAAQYVNGFREVLDFGAGVLSGETDFEAEWENAVIHLQLELMANFPDTLIARKCGRAIAEESARMARAILEAGWPQSSAGREQLLAFDRWLRADGHKRNPGTTADVITAVLFVCYRERIIRMPRAIGPTV